MSSAWMKFDKCDFLENWQVGEVFLFCLMPRRCVWSGLVSTIHKTKIYFQLVSRSDVQLKLKDTMNLLFYHYPKEHDT